LLPISKIFLRPFADGTKENALKFSVAKFFSSGGEIREWQTALKDVMIHYNVLPSGIFNEATFSKAVVTNFTAKTLRMPTGLHSTNHTANDKLA
jgi:hypothetical protein